MESPLHGVDGVQEDDNEVFSDVDSKHGGGDAAPGLAANFDFQQAAPIFSEHVLLEDKARTLLFSGSRLTSLEATMILLNFCRTHHQGLKPVFCVDSSVSATFFRVG